MAIFKFTIPTKNKKTPSLNEYISAERIRIYSRGNKIMTKGAKMKSDWQSYICKCIDKDIPNTHLFKPVTIHYHYFEENRKRDVGNIHAPMQKFIEDALQNCKVIQNDNQKYVVGFTATVDIDALNPRVEVEIEEI